MDDEIRVKDAEREAAQRLSKKEQAAIRRAFTAFDIDGNDTIDLSELHELFKVLNITNIPPEDAERRFRQLDTNRSNSLDYWEFLAMFLAIKDQYQCTPDMCAEVLEKKPPARTSEDVDRLSYFLYYHVPFFGQFNRAMRTELCRQMRCTEYEEGDWLYTQGASADAVFIPLEGVVSVWAKPVRSDAKDGPNDEWLQTGPRGRISEQSLGRHSGGVISFGARSAYSAKSRAPSIAILASDDEGSEVSTVDSRFPKQRSSTVQEPEQQQPSHARLTAAALDSLQKQMQRQPLGQGPTAPSPQKPPLPRPSPKSARNMGMLAKQCVPASQIRSKADDDDETCTNASASKPAAATPRQLRGVAFGLDVNFREQAPRDRKASHLRKPSAAESNQSVAFGLDVNFREQEPRDRKTSHTCKPSVAESSHSATLLPLALITHSNTDHDATCTHNGSPSDALHQSPSNVHHQSPSNAHHQHTRNASHTDHPSITSEALAAPPDSQSPPPKLLTSLSGKSRGDGGRSRPQGSGGVAFEAAQEGTSWEGMKGGARKRALPSLLSAASGRRRPSGGSMAWGSTASMHTRRPTIAKADPHSMRALLWSGEVSSLTSNDQVGANLVTELNWAVSDMHNQALQHSRCTKKRVQVPAFVGFCCLGQWLGETSLLGHLGVSGPHRHRASVLAATTVTCCVLDQRVFKMAMDFVRGSCSLTYMLRPTYLMDLSHMEPKARSTPEEAKLAHYLSCVPSLAHLPSEIRIKLSRSLHPRGFTSGDVIIRQGLLSDGMYIILEGDVGIFQKPLGEQGLAWKLSKQAKTSSHPDEPSTAKANTSDGGAISSGSDSHSPKHRGRLGHSSPKSTASSPSDARQHPARGGGTAAAAAAAGPSAAAAAARRPASSERGLERSHSSILRRKKLSSMGANSPLVQMMCARSAGSEDDTDQGTSGVSLARNIQLQSSLSSPLGSPGTLDALLEVRDEGDDAEGGPKMEAVGNSRHSDERAAMCLGADATAAGAEGHGALVDQQATVKSTDAAELPGHHSTATFPAHFASPFSCAPPSKPLRPPPKYTALAIDTHSPPRKDEEGYLPGATPMTDAQHTGGESSDVLTPLTSGKLSPLEAQEPSLVRRAHPRPSDAGTSDISSMSRPRFADIASASSSMHERHMLSINLNTKEATAAALRARHARHRMLVGNMDPAAAITRKHVVDASKFAHMVGGQAGSAIAGLITPREPQQDMNVKLLVESLEGHFGPMQQALSAGATCGEVELLSVQGNPLEEDNNTATSALSPHLSTSSPHKSPKKASKSSAPWRRDHGRVSPSGKRGASPDLALPEVRKRGASVLALSPCSMLRIDVVAYQETLLAWRQQELAKRMEFYKGVGPLKGLRHQTLAFLDAAVMWLSVKRGTLLQQIGEPLRGIYFIKSGQVGVYMPPAHMSTRHDRELCEVARDKYNKEVQDAGGQDVMDTTSHNYAGTRSGGASCFSAWSALRPVAMLGPQDFFGEDALLSGTHTAAVLTETPCELAWIRPADMPALDRIGISQLLHYGNMRHAWRSGRRHKGPDLYHQSALRQTATETGETSLASNSAQRLEAELLQHAIAMGRQQSEGTMWAASAVTKLRAAHSKAKGQAAHVEDSTQQSKDQGICGHSTTLSVLRGEFDLDVYAKWFIAEDNLRRKVGSKVTDQDTAALPQRMQHGAPSSEHVHTHAPGHEDKHVASFEACLIDHTEGHPGAAKKESKEAANAVAANGAQSLTSHSDWCASKAPKSSPRGKGSLEKTTDHGSYGAASAGLHVNSAAEVRKQGAPQATATAAAAAAAGAAAGAAAPAPAPPAGVGHWYGVGHSHTVGHLQGPGISAAVPTTSACTPEGRLVMGVRRAPPTQLPFNSRHLTRSPALSSSLDAALTTAGLVGQPASARSAETCDDSRASRAEAAHALLCTLAMDRMRGCTAELVTGRDVDPNRAGEVAGWLAEREAGGNPELGARWAAADARQEALQMQRLHILARSLSRKTGLSAKTAEWVAGLSIPSRPMSAGSKQPGARENCVRGWSPQSSWHTRRGSGSGMGRSRGSSSGSSSSSSSSNSEGGDDSEHGSCKGDALLHPVFKRSRSRLSKASRRRGGAQLLPEPPDAPLPLADPSQELQGAQQDHTTTHTPHTNRPAPPGELASGDAPRHASDQYALQGQQDHNTHVSAPPGQLSDDASLHDAQQDRQEYANSIHSGPSRPPHAHDHNHQHTHEPPQHSREPTEHSRKPTEHSHEPLQHSHEHSLEHSHEYSREHSPEPPQHSHEPTEHSHEPLQHSHEHNHEHRYKPPQHSHEHSHEPPEHSQEPTEHGREPAEHSHEHSLEHSYEPPQHSHEHSHEQSPEPTEHSHEPPEHSNEHSHEHSHEPPQHSHEHSHEPTEHSLEHSYEPPEHSHEHSQEAEGTAAQCGGGTCGPMGKHLHADDTAEGQASTPREQQQGAGAAAAEHAGPPGTENLESMALVKGELPAASDGAASATPTTGEAAAAVAAVPRIMLPPNHDSAAAEQVTNAAAAAAAAATTPAAAAEASGHTHPQLPSIHQSSSPQSCPHQLQPASASPPSPQCGYKPGLSSRLLARPPHLHTSTATALDFLMPSIAAETVPSAVKPDQHHHQQQQQLTRQSEDDSADWAHFHPHLKYRGFGKRSCSIAPRQRKQQQQQQQQQEQQQQLHCLQHQHQQKQPQQGSVDGPAYAAHTFLRPPPSPRALQRVTQAIAAQMPQRHQGHSLVSWHTKKQPQLNSKPGHPLYTAHQSRNH